MKKILGLVALLLLVVGCSKSEIVIRNRAEAPVAFYFRGASYDIASGGTTTIDKIPDGKFSYSTVYTLPAGITNSTENDLGGSLEFINHGTKIAAEYASVTDSGSYKISFIYSSNAN